MNADLILDNAPVTAPCADSIFEENDDLIFSIADDAVDFALANLLENADLMLSSFPPVRVFAVLMREFIVSFMPVNVADTIPLIHPPFSLYADFMLFSFVDTLDFAVSMSEVALSFIFVKSVDHFVFISETFE